MKKTASCAALLLTLATAAATASAAYNDVILGDKPVMFLGMDTAATGAQADLSGHGNDGRYVGGTPKAALLPDGEPAADFNASGSGQYLTVPASPALSVPTSRALTIESWIKPDTLQFAYQESEGYVYWLGKGNPTNGYEYANRMYSYSNTAGRPNRISDYDWNVSGGLGSGAYFQDTVYTTQWIHVVDVIDMSTGYIDIYKNGVLRGHVPLSQYSVKPGTTASPFNVGTRNNNSYFQGAIGKVAVYNYHLSAAQIANHYAAMTAPAPTPVASAPVIGSVSSSGVTQTAANVSWTTDKVSHSQVEYGLSSGYGALTAQSSTAGTSHAVALSGLSAGTLYHYRVKSLDSATGLTGVSGDYTFTTPAAPTAPAISGVSASGLTQTTAAIAWTTDKASAGQVEYGLSTAYGALTPQSAAGTSHSVALSGLAAGTLYHFRVKSYDAATGLTGVSGDYTFTTAAAVAATAPAISNVASSGITQTGATITWMTDKASHSQVEYGVSTGYGALSYQSTATGTYHSLALSGLNAGTVYHYRVRSLDSTTGLTGVSGDYTLATQAPSVAADAITNVAASNVTTSGANVTWSTSLVSHSQVEYGLTTGYGSKSYQSTASGTSHWIPLSGLKSGTTYHYRVLSLDANGKTAVSGDYTFKTSGASA